MGLPSSWVLPDPEPDAAAICCVHCTQRIKTFDFGNISCKKKKQIYEY